MSLAKSDVITLSKGSVWARQYSAFEYHQNAWPDFATAYVEFRNTRGALLATITATEVTSDHIRFLAQPEDHAAVPAGAKFEVFVETDDGPVLIRYGTVIRREATFYDAPAAERVEDARAFADTFQRARLGDRWEAIRGHTRIYDNPGDLPNGLGPNTGLFANQPSAIKYHRQLSKNSVEIGVQLVVPPNTAGRSAVVFSADIAFTTGLAIDFDSINDNIEVCRVTGPTNLVSLGLVADYNIENNDYFRIIYNDLTDTVAVYHGTDTSPMGTPWVDEFDVVPHGNGYCHTGFIFRPGTALIFGSPGPQPCGWAAKDTV